MPTTLCAGVSRVHGSRPVFALGFIAIAAILAAAPAAAYDVPLAGSPYFLQTSGPTAGIGIGDWYTAKLYRAIYEEYYLDEWEAAKVA